MSASRIANFFYQKSTKRYGTLGWYENSKDLADELFWLGPDFMYIGTVHDEALLNSARLNWQEGKRVGVI
jgi:hypothetical protein